MKIRKSNRYEYRLHTFNESMYRREYTDFIFALPKKYISLVVPKGFYQLEFLMRTDIHAAKKLLMKLCRYNGNRKYKYFKLCIENAIWEQS